MSQVGNNYINNNASEIVKLLKQLSKEDREKFIRELDDDERDALMYNWDIWARPKQLEYRNNLFITLARCGRGFGKSRMSSEFCIERERKGSKHFMCGNINPGSVRDINVLGESGILACAPPWNKPEYQSSKACVVWPSGAKMLLFSGAAPDVIRGKQAEAIICDELFAWKYPEESFAMAEMCCRLGDNPQILIASTPKTTQFMRKIMARDDVHIITGSTFENKANLAKTYLKSMEETYGDTRLGRQELYGELLNDNPNAIFNREYIDRNRVDEVQEPLSYIVVGIDPAVSNKKKSNLTGISVCGLGRESGHAYVLEDLSMDGPPESWGKEAVKAYHNYNCDCILYEDNQGGLMVEAVIHSIDPDVVCKPLHAVKGKAGRAEPVSIKYEKGLVHHVGTFAKLEDQMVDFEPGDTGVKSPDRMDALVWCITYLLINKLRTTAPIIIGATASELGSGTFNSLSDTIFKGRDNRWNQ